MARAAALVVALILTLTACGGGGNDGAARAEYIAKADSVCGALRAQVNALPFASPDPNVLAQAFRDGARLGDEQVRQLRAIPAPEGDGEEIDAILDLAEQLNQTGREAADAKAAGDDVRFRSLINQSRAITQRQRELALNYGFRDCAGRRPA